MLPLFNHSEKWGEGELGANMIPGSISQIETRSNRSSKVGIEQQPPSWSAKRNVLNSEARHSKIHPMGNLVYLD